MELMDHIGLLVALDWVAAAFVILASLGISWWIERPHGTRPSMTMLMADHRREWMKVFVERDPRIFDSQIMGGLREATAFFASTCLLAIGGVLALIGNTDPLRDVAEGVTTTDVPALIWQLKLALVAGFLSNAFLRFVWSNRVFGYCAVIMASVPNDPADPAAFPRAAQAAELNIRAAVNFNRGLRGMYFALAAVTWLVGSVPLIVATLLVTWMVWSREFASVPRSILLKDRT